ncbi:MAG: MarC family protein [Phycisphaerae bacterium]|nr:MarC family protein [Phycisphaerae bacterium]
MVTKATEIVEACVLLWAVIDPIGTIPVFIAVTRSHADEHRSWIALRAVLVAGGVLFFFLIAGQLLLEAMGVPLIVFQISGGVVLFLFSLTMIFGESKPDEEVKIVRSHQETAVFPLAVPSIAGPGAIIAVMVLTDNHRFSILHQVGIAVIIIGILAITLVLLVLSGRIYKYIGNAGASVISRIMGLILSAVAANNILVGLKEYFG